MLAAGQREWFLQEPAGAIAQRLAGARTIAVPSLKELFTAAPAFEAIAVARWFDLSLAAYLLSPEERVYTWERLLASLWTDPDILPGDVPPDAPGLACLALSARLRANAIAPGLIKTDFARYLWETPEILKSSTAGAPLRRIGEPDEIAGMAIFLASKAGAFTTGQGFVIDGGATI